MTGITSFPKISADQRSGRTRFQNLATYSRELDTLAGPPRCCESGGVVPLMETGRPATNSFQENCTGRGTRAQIFSLLLTHALAHENGAFRGEKSPFPAAPRRCTVLSRDLSCGLIAKNDLQLTAVTTYNRFSGGSAPFRVARRFRRVCSVSFRNRYQSTMRWSKTRRMQLSLPIARSQMPYCCSGEPDFKSERGY
jgi:hypothetical protein